MHSHPDADAFMRCYLEQPVDATTRLVFADWLDETGEAHNAAWASYIRLKAEADRHDFGTRERSELDRQADAFAPEIRARLTISANKFVGYPKSLLLLLPAPNITVRLTGFEVANVTRDYMPESVARANLALPLDVQGNTVLIATANPRDIDLAQKLTFILNKHIVAVGAEGYDVQAAIDRSYPFPALETVDEVLVEFVDTAGPHLRTSEASEPAIDDDDAPVVRLVNLILLEAVNMRTDRVLLYPDPDALSVRFRIENEWVERDRCPRRLHRSVMRRLAMMAGIYPGELFNGVVSEIPVTGVILFPLQSARFRVDVRFEFPPDGPAAQLDISEAPA